MIVMLSNTRKKDEEGKKGRRRGRGAPALRTAEGKTVDFSQCR